MKVIVHIGLHKTATTTLQKQLFPRLEGVRFFDAATPSTAATLYQLEVQDPCCFDGDRARSFLESQFSREAVNLISSEGLSGSLYCALGKRDLDHRSSILENLQRTLPEAKILLVLRRQDQYAKAVYRQYLTLGGVLDPLSFFGRDQHTKAYFPRDRFRYPEYVDALRKRFSAGVHVGIFEQLVESPREFIRGICDFLEVEAPASLSLARMNRTRLGSAGLALSRQLNRLFRSPLNPGGILPGVPQRRPSGDWRFLSPVYFLQERWPGSGRISDESRLGRICRQLLAEQAAGNRVLQECLKTDLRQYGYF